MSRDGQAWTEDELRRRAEALSGRAIVVNLRGGHDRRLVDWARRHGLLTLVDRSSVWGSPFIVGRRYTRDQAVDAYAIYLQLHLDLLQRVAGLRGKALGCWCSPARCHADVLAELANRARAARGG
jgi:hypothetical protein